MTDRSEQRSSGTAVARPARAARRDEDALLAAAPRAGRRRVVIEGVAPAVELGRFAVKRAVDEALVVEADVFGDGHDVVAAELLVRAEGDPDWRPITMDPLVNDRWRASFRPGAMGRWRYTVRGWVDAFATWRRDLTKRVGASQDVRVDLLAGAAALREQAAACEDAAAAAQMRAWADVLADDERAPAERTALALDAEVLELTRRWPCRRFAALYPHDLPLVVDRVRARFSAWYELFPRSAAPAPGRHGTLRDCGARLEYAASMGFDVVYLPPIHPIGRQARKGRNNATTAEPGDPGSPWAIGAAEGGHTAVHPELGTLEDLRWLVGRARELGMELALDLAFQCAPDHPWVAEHPEWFRQRPDGTIQSAENPPKKYQDIYPFDFECRQWRGLWEALRDVVLFWVGQGVRIFRVDNPHTKPFPFWEWLIAAVKADHPDVLFLSEAFTRPRVMARLAKLGFTQSYTYFTWRNTKWELQQYFTELTHTELREYFRPNAWPNTPDIDPEFLQLGGRPAHALRLVLAATLCASYGIYGPVFELCEATPCRRASSPGTEEYQDSEKYQLRRWDLDAAHSLKGLIARVNGIRRECPALQTDRGLRFHPTSHEDLLCYSKQSEDRQDLVVVVAGLDPHHEVDGWVELPLLELGVDPVHGCQAHDLLGDERLLWSGARQHVRVRPWELPAKVFKLRRRVRTERDFDYYL